MSNEIDFAELLITKFCHDISGHISAIDNGVELLQGTLPPDEIQQKAFTLLARSSSDLIARLKIFRFVYGMRSNEGEINILELNDLLIDFYRHSKIRIIWDNNFADKTQLFSNTKAKLMINVILIVASCLIYGGEISISTATKTQELIISGIGHQVKIDENIEAIITKQELLPLQLSNVQIHLASQLANELQAKVAINHQPSSISFHVKFATS